jgi:hypothetical protein
MNLLIVTITFPLASSCSLLWKCGLIINLVRIYGGIARHIGTLVTFYMSLLSFLLLILPHVLYFFLEEAISHMVSFFLAPKARERNLFCICPLFLTLLDLFFLSEFVSCPWPLCFSFSPTLYKSLIVLGDIFS